MDHMAPCGHCGRPALVIPALICSCGARQCSRCSERDCPKVQAPAVDLEVTAEGVRGDWRVLAGKRAPVVRVPFDVLMRVGRTGGGAR